MQKKHLELIHRRSPLTVSGLWLLAVLLVGLSAGSARSEEPACPDCEFTCTLSRAGSELELKVKAKEPMVVEVSSADLEVWTELSAHSASVPSVPSDLLDGEVHVLVLAVPQGLQGDILGAALDISDGQSAWPAPCAIVAP